MSTSYLDLLTLEFEGRSLQLWPEQLSNVTKAFRLIEDTIILVSERGISFIPEDGVFVDVDNLDRWTVQGDTGHRSLWSDHLECEMEASGLPTPCSWIWE